VIRGLEARVAAAEAALGRGPDGVTFYKDSQLAAVLERLGRPTDQDGLFAAKRQLWDDPELSRAWREAGHTLDGIVLILDDGDWNL